MTSQFTHDSLIKLGKEIHKKEIIDKKKQESFYNLKSKFEQTKEFDPSQYILDFIKESPENNINAQEIIKLVGHIKTYRDVYEHQKERIEKLKLECLVNKDDIEERETQITRYIHELGEKEIEIKQYICDIQELNCNIQTKNERIKQLSQSYTQLLVYLCVTVVSMVCMATKYFVFS